MSSWLGFSLTPQPRIDHEGGFVNRDELPKQQAACFSTPNNPSLAVMPVRSDGSLSLSHHHLSQDWRYENDGTGHDDEKEYHEGEGPKLEDFLGSSSCCNGYSNSPPSSTDADDHQHHSSNFNVNVINAAAAAAADHLDLHHHHHLNPSQITNRTSYSTTHDHHSHDLIMYHQQQHQRHVPFESATSVGGFKSWLRGQTPFLLPSSSSSSRDDESSDHHHQSLSLAMNTPVSSSPSPSQQQEQQGNGGTGRVAADHTRTRPVAKEPVPRKSIDTFGERTSQYRGVTRHRWTGRYEAHLWDNSCRKEGQKRKGRQVYLGGYDKEEKAAKAYDLAALKYWSSATHTNFPLCTYEKELEEMKVMTRQEFVANLRRKSSGFSRGASVYRGVTRHHQHGRWQARIGRIAGNKDLYLGTFSTQEEAAEAYDIAAIKFRGTSAVPNFDISRYDVKRICSSSTLLATDLANRSPRDSAAAPLPVEDYYLCAASTSPPQPPALSNGDASDELVDMVWNANADHDHQHQTTTTTTTNNGAPVVAPPGSGNASS